MATKSLGPNRFPLNRICGLEAAKVAWKSHGWEAMLRMPYTLSRIFKYFLVDFNRFLSFLIDFENFFRFFRLISRVFFVDFEVFFIVDRVPNKNLLGGIRTKLEFFIF